MRSRNITEVANKDRVLNDFEKIFDQEGAVGLLNVKQDSPLVFAIDLVLQHGLRDTVRGYWCLVQSLTHSTTLKSLEAFVKYISSSQQKGLAWTFYTLEEGSLEYYLSSLIQDTKTLDQHYMEHSLLRDESLSKRVVAAITSLRAEAADVQALQSMESSLVSESPFDQLTTSTPSLTSPVDSGVALIDSDTSSSDVDKNEDCLKAPLYEKSLPCLASSFTTTASTSSDNTLAECDFHETSTLKQKPILSTNNMTKPSIRTQNNSKDEVCKRAKKKKKNEPGKRVSFHQDSIDDSDTLVKLRHPNINKFYVEGRYSWAGEGDSMLFEKEPKSFRVVKSEIYENKGLSSCMSIFDSELAVEADCDSSSTTLDETKNNIEIVCEKLTNVVKQSLGLKTKEKVETMESINCSLKSDFGWQKVGLAERGVPEGQEDPGGVSEYECLMSAQQRSQTVARSSMDLTSDSEWSLDTPDKVLKKFSPYNQGPQKNMLGYHNWSSRILHEVPSKTSLVKRFLRSIPTRKPFKEKKQPTKSNLYIKGVKLIPELSQDLLDNLNKEIEQNKPIAKKEEDEVVTDEMRAALHKMVLMNNDEKIYKVYRVASTEGVPLLAVLTDRTLYMTGLNSDNGYSRRHHISYHTLDTVMIGPEYQTVMLVTVDHSVTVTVISALGQALVMHMISYLALAVSRVTHSQLSVCILSLPYMQALRKAVYSQSSVAKEEKLIYYRYIRVEDSHMAGGPFSPLGPTKTGHLMYRSHNHARWLPGYIHLKGGILYVFSDSKQTRPKHVLSFHVGYFGGCRRVVNSNRPHAFEVLPFSQRGLYGTFQFAAADDYEASEWLQMFIQTSYSMCEEEHVSEEPLLGCGLLLTSRHLLTLDFPDKVLSCARLQDITTIRTTTTCCILETSCREVQEKGGDWILYFLTDQAVLEFLDTLCQIRPELKQVVVEKWECEVLHSHCMRTSQLVTTAWEQLLRPSCNKHNLQ